MNKLHEQIIPAYLVRGSGQIAFWCHYCRCVHRHGDCGKGMEGGGHRGAHCSSDDSPLRGAGIFLDVVGEVLSEGDLRPKRKPYSSKCSAFAPPKKPKTMRQCKVG